jgi:deoxyribodipyrimidine photo-lyase
MQIAYHFPNVFGNNFKHVIKWENNVSYFKKWCNGETGYPIVDACMKHMNETGFMPNRGRMIVASFLTKILHIDWRWGEQYFATRLTDYDPANNNGGWQWSAGTGVDAQPYFRIFNPFTQADKYDSDFIYRDRWLSNNWRDDAVSKKYIVDYDVERVRALKLIK